MSDSILERITGRVEDFPRRGEDLELEDMDSFGWLRGVRDRALMLEVRHRNGNISCFGYSWLEKAMFDPSEGITLQFGGTFVLITGQNLNRMIRPNISLFQGIVRHKVPWVRESVFGEGANYPSNPTIIDGIQVK
jgi:hypothetical protein